MESDGEMYMTPADFFASIGVTDAESAPAVFRTYFAMADTDGNELLSYQEYSFFVSLLSTQEADFR